jgi:hypothetical protein
MAKTKRLHCEGQSSVGRSARKRRSASSRSDREGIIRRHRNPALVDENGRPAVKLATTERGGGLALAGESEGNYAQLFGRGLAVTKDGQPQQIP